MTNRKPCPRCNGLRTVPNEDDRSFNVRMPCPECGATGTANPETNQPTLPGLDRSDPKPKRRTISQSGRELRDEAMERAIQHAGAEWRDRALAVIWTAARKYEFVHSDDFHRIADQMNIGPPPDGRAWGSVTKTASTSGWISKTGEQRESTRPICHAQPKPIYRSNIYREDGTGWEAQP